MRDCEQSGLRQASPREALRNPSIRGGRTVGVEAGVHNGDVAVLQGPFFPARPADDHRHTTPVYEPLLRSDQGLTYQPSKPSLT